MQDGGTTFFDVLPNAALFLGDIFFRWIPATVIGLTNTSTSSPFANLTEPVAAWDVPVLLSQAASPGAYEALVKGWFVFSLISISISIPFMAVSVYCWLRIIQIRRAERLAVRAAQRTVETRDVPRTQLRWSRILEQASASRPEGWRLAILEADIMLNELLDLQGYKGETMAEKMKQVDRAQFHSIDAAWEAHKIRNRIAHEGTAIDLTPREARRVVALYERVFKEFKYI